MAENLTPQQQQAVSQRGGRLLVSAAAGSGKTKVLVDRLLSYLTDPEDPAELDEFLIITYTKAAASELRGKIAAKLTQRIAQEPENRHLQRQMQKLYLTHISTVHGFCSVILKEYAYRLDLSADFRVADENECVELRDRVLQELLEKAYSRIGEDEFFAAFVDSQGVGRDDRQIPDIIQKVYDSARCHLNPDAWLESCLTDAAPEGVTDAGQTVWGRFLMEDLFRYLDCQILALTRARDEAGEAADLGKIADFLTGILLQLQELRGSESWEEVCRRKNIDYGRFPTVRKPMDQDLKDGIKAVFDACKSGLANKLRNFEDDSEQVLKDLKQSSAAAQGLIALVRQFDADFRQAKRSRHVLDFSDLEQKTLDLLLGTQRTGLTAAAGEIGRRFREIMVDEYQDSNGVQDAIFMALTRQRQNCFMVGDVKQSIYQFRLADPGIFLEKYNTYADAEDAVPGEGRKVLLSHNFRSGGEIIEGINDVFSACMSPEVGGLHYGEAEALREGVPHAPLPDAAVELYALEADEDSYAFEAAFAARKIRKMLHDGTLVREGDSFRPVTPEDIVILLRSPGSVGQDYRKALEDQGIRCAMGGGMDLLQTAEIGTLRSLLQTVSNPRQDIPLLSALASPVFGFTADDLAAIRARQKSGYIYDALRQWRGEKTESFLQTLDTLRRESRMQPLTVLLERCFTLTRMDSIYGAMPGGKARKANLQTFYQLAADYENTGIRTLDQFLDYLDSMEGSDRLSVSGSSAGCVRIMSIHKSKGLEFPVVFLCGLKRKFNQDSLQKPVLCDKELGLGLVVADNRNRIRYPALSKRAIAVSMKAEGISEELRVLYVAMTRAKDRLIMTYTAQNLEKDLSGIALRKRFDNGTLLCREAGCFGTWVLTAAMLRTEAGELHALGGHPGQTHVSDHPWKIRVIQDAPQDSGAAAVEEARENAQPVSVEELEAALSFRYAHQAAVHAPSKQTATGRRGRSREDEAMEKTPEPRGVIRAWRKPSFREAKRDGKAYGNAFHSAMQFIRYEACRDAGSVDAEIERMVSEGFLTSEQGEMVDRKKLLSFFESPLGRKLRDGAQYLREFKFSVLDDGNHYAEGLDGEKVLLQGVVDCAILEPDGITIIDFKTDHVTEETAGRTAERYRPQLDTYGDALHRIFEREIKGKYLYFFQLNQFVKL